VTRRDEVHVGFDLLLSVGEPADLVLSVSPAMTAGELKVERFEVLSDGNALEPRLLLAEHGTRLQRVSAPAGQLSVSYAGHLLPHEERLAETASEVERLTYLRPSRFCPSDRLAGLANTEFGRLPRGRARADALAAWVGQRLSYVGGSSGPLDTSVDTLLSGEGVCRDYAHLVVTLARALELPARFTSVYAPGLNPMDFHAVAEIYVDGGWYVFDATGLAPRSSMVRIATGRDAADTAFLSVFEGRADLVELTVHAYTDGVLDQDDPAVLMSLD
jgi:hypothetical protein